MTTIFFQIAAQKYPNKAFLVRNSAIFILHENLQQDKFEDADLKHDNNILFSNSSPKIRKLGISGPKFKDFYFATNFVIRQIWGCWFKYDNCFFEL